MINMSGLGPIGSNKDKKTKSTLGPIGSQRHQKKKAQDRERKLADRLGGEATPNSGATKMKPGDVHLPNFLIDDKYTGKKSYSLTTENINKLCKEARSMSKSPAFVIYFENSSGIYDLNPKEWAIIPLETAIELGYFEEEEI